MSSGNGIPEYAVQVRALILAVFAEACKSPLGSDAYNEHWHVSMATVVDGIIRLISSNPKQDANELLKEMPARKRSVLTVARPKDQSPLRPLYLEGNDRVLYSIIANYLTACRSTFWQSAREGSFIIKTVGIQALFDILRLLGPEVLDSKKASVSFFMDRLAGAKDLDFASAQFRNASGSGRGEIKNAIKEAIQL